MTENGIPMSVQEGRVDVLQRQFARLISLHCEASLTEDEARHEELSALISNMLLDELTCSQFNLMGTLSRTILDLLISASKVRAFEVSIGKHTHENCEAEYETYKAIAELNGEEL